MVPRACVVSLRSGSTRYCSTHHLHDCLYSDAPSSGARRHDESRLQHNVECFLIEEMVVDEAGGSKPVDYRVYVNGGCVQVLGSPPSLRLKYR